MENLALALFPALMAFAVFSDLLTLTIPNLISLLLISSYFVMSVWLHTPWQIIAAHASCGMLVLTIGFVLFEMRVIGGGDAKLASATALWLGLENLIEYALVFSLIGGGLAMFIFWLR